MRTNLQPQLSSKSEEDDEHQSEHQIIAGLTELLLMSSSESSYSDNDDDCESLPFLPITDSDADFDYLDCVPVVQPLLTHAASHVWIST